MRRTPVGSTIALVLLSTVALSLVVNVASAELPEALLPYRWLAWPLLFLLAGVVIVVTVRADRQGATTGDPDRSRRDLIDAQRDSWITGVLEQSLYAKARLRLAFTTAVDEAHPWDVKVIAPESAARRLNARQTVTDVFDDEMRGRMLILGAPGAGKTTTMLELLGDLLDRAEGDAAAPIPLMVNLATWNDSRGFTQWMLRETSRRYRVPAEHLSAWLDTAKLTLLLDGLDEVAEKHRLSCLRAVNALRESHPNLRLIVCCRSEEYGALGEKHALRGRVEIQPLTPADVDRFLKRHRLDTARRVLDQDSELRAMVTTPLLLSVLMLAHRDEKAAVGGNGDPVERLFTAYVRRMLVQRTGSGISPGRLVAQLAFIAHTMRRNGHTLFTFDGLSDALAGYERPAWRTLGYAPLLAAAGWWWGGPGGLLLGAFTALWFLVNVDRVRLNTFGYSIGSDGRREEGRLQNNPFDDLLDGFGDITDDAVLWTPIAALGLATGGYVWWLHGFWTGVWFLLATGLAALVALSGVQGGHLTDPRLRPGRSELPSPVALAFRRLGLVRAAVGSVLVFASTLLITVWSTGFDESVRFAAFAALGVGCYTFFGLGGGVVTEQRRLRADLADSGRLDYPARPVLDHAADTLLLQRLGDDYLFPHLLLRDYFAELWGQRSERGPLRADRIAEITHGLD